MLVTSEDLLNQARAGGYAIPSPDFVDSNSARAFVRVAEEVGAPVSTPDSASTPFVASRAW